MKTDSEEREFTGSSLSSIFGGPLSWVAMFGALTAVGSLIPVLVYPLGGGYYSLSHVLLFPLAGYLLGPWAGFIAAGIGATIGLFIAPGAYPLGVIDVVLFGAIFGLSYGLLARRWRALMLIWWLFSFPIIFIFPYRWPGPAQGFSPPAEPAYSLSWSWFALVFLIWLVWAYSPLGYWVGRNRKFPLQIVGFILTSLMGGVLPNGIGGALYYYVLKKPVQVAILENWQSLPLFAAAIVIGVVVFALFQALGRTGLRRVSGSLFDETMREKDDG